MPLLFWEVFHLTFTGAWVGLLPPTLLWWRESVLWIALMSLWANISSHFAAWQSARTERYTRERDKPPRARIRAARVEQVPRSRRVRPAIGPRPRSGRG